MVVVLEVIATSKRHYRVDPDRIYLMGHSMGGYGTNRIGMHFPDLFAAIAPFQGTDAEELHANLRNLRGARSPPSRTSTPAGSRPRRCTTSSRPTATTRRDQYGMKIHEYSSIYEDLPGCFATSARTAATRTPPS